MWLSLRLQERSRADTKKGPELGGDVDILIQRSTKLSIGQGRGAKVYA